MKSIINNLPEYYLIILAILAGYSPPFYINPIFVVILAILIFQIVSNNKTLGLLIGVLFFIGNLYFLFALRSEFLEFDEFNSDAQQLIFVGMLIWIINLIVSSFMIYKYSKTDITQIAK